MAIKASPLTLYHAIAKFTIPKTILVCLTLSHYIKLDYLYLSYIKKININSLLPVVMKVVFYRFFNAAGKQLLCC